MKTHSGKFVLTSLVKVLRCYRRNIWTRLWRIKQAQ